ncbi:MAG: branched-chain amino acid ABC transporter permease [Rhodobiaceae bacterium]|nr:branched-chain amino acid ABC transporter permease [Rhodobiaceae bacterium]MCC0057016.1 branched-chain amino acid ABC transporter permease [Rhodobiaceae bacterium]
MLDNISILIAAPTITLDLVINGLLIGALFALTAYGMALVWGVMRIINVAQGEFVILGGYMTYALTTAGLPPLLTIPCAAAITFALGYVLHYAVITRIVDRDLFVSVLATFGISIVIQQLLNTVFGGDVRVVDAGLGTQFFMGGLIAVSEIKIAAFLLVCVLALVLVLFLKRSRLGQAIRATAQNPRAARVLGIDTNRVYAMTFALNAAICGACGSLVAMAYTIHPYIGLPYTIRSFMIVVVAGLGNLPGVVAAGLGLGAAENIAGFVLGTQFQLAFVFSLLVVVLVWRNWRLSRKRQYLK